MLNLISFEYNKLIRVKMQSTHLTDNGVEKIVNKISNVIVQTTSIVQKIKGNSKFIMCDLSDGFVKLKSAVIIEEESNSGGKVAKENSVIQLVKYSVEAPKKNSQSPVIIIEGYKVLHANVVGVIGNPVTYDEFLKNGKVNEDADNAIVLKNEKIASKQTTLPITKKEEKKGGPGGNTRKIQMKYQEQEERKNNSIQKREQLSKPKGNQKSKNGPIVKNQIKREEPSLKIKQQRPQGNHNLIKQLFKGIENWSIVGRVIFAIPLKQIMTKKGTQTTILGLELGDKSGTIQCNGFGQTALKFENTFRQDDIIELSGAQVSQSTYQNKTELKIILSQNTKVSLREDDGSIPFAEDFCINVQKLSQMPPGSSARVICLVKDSGQINEFVSKAGKPMKKKPIYLCDPQNKIQVQVLLWNDKCDTHFQKFPLIISSIEVTEYNGSKQFKLSNLFRYRVLKQHSFRKYIKDLQNIEMVNVGSGKKAPAKTKINNLGELTAHMDEVTEAGVWSQAICYLEGIRMTGKNYYMSCPHCKKKVFTQTDSICQKCGKDYQSSLARYILSVHLIDSYGEVWATCYDQIAELLLGSDGQRFPASQFVKLTEEGIKQKVGEIKHRELKVLLSTKSEEYNGTINKKTSVIKLLPINYKEEIRSRLQQLQLV